MLLQMSKVEIIGPKHDFNQVLTHIHEMGVLDIEDLSTKFKGDMDIRQMQLSETGKAGKDMLEDCLVKINSFITALRAKKPADAAQCASLEQMNGEELLSEAKKLIDSLESQTKDLTTKKRVLEMESSNLEKYAALFERVAPLAKKLVALKGFDTTMLLADKRDIDVLEIIKETLAEITQEQYQLISAEIDESSVGVIIVFNSRFGKQVRDFLWSQHVNEVRLPEELEKLSYEKALAKMKARREELPIETEEIAGKLDTLGAEYDGKLWALSNVMTDRISELNIINFFGATDYTFVVVGWLPKSQVHKFSESLLAKFGKKVVVEEMALSAADKRAAPIKYLNRFGARSFEPIMTLFGSPKSGTIDATPFVAFFFPLFFGAILGDMGYALVLLGAAFWLRRRYKNSPAVLDASIIVVMAGISSFVFGFLYGEFFGDWPEILHIITPVHVLGIEFPINRAENILGVLYFAIALGAIHISVGLALGAMNAFRAHHLKHALEKAGLLLTLLALISIGVGGQIQEIFPLGSIGMVMLVIAIPLLIYGGGFIGAFEVLGTLGNVVSYARIMALGLVSVMLANLANQVSLGFSRNILLAVVFGALIHAVNLLIHVFTPTIHALRLNFVEFFGKFYEFGGKAYKPFQKGGVQ